MRNLYIFKLESLKSVGEVVHDRIVVLKFSGVVPTLD